MRLSIALAALALLAGTALWAADPVPLNVKTGQWEATVNSQFTGMPVTVPVDKLAQLPPEQRAKIEAMMKQMGGPRTTTSKSCIKPEDLAKFNPSDMAKSCKMTVLTSTPSKQEIRMDCDTNGNKQTGMVHIEAVNSETIKFSVESGGTANGQAANMNISGTSKWIGPTCSDAK